MIEATIIADSIGENAPRLTTMKWTYPKFVHQESLRHRTIYIYDNLSIDADFSFSVSSARAIPFAKLLEEVRNKDFRAMPVSWGLEKKGMSPDDENPENRQECESIWELAALDAAQRAESLANLGIHKSICNRLIEPFIHVNCLATSADAGWQNFFELRLDNAADPTLRALARKAFDQLNGSMPKLLKPGEWHLPFADDEQTKQECANTSDLIKISVARCARLTYESFETKNRSTLEDDIKLFDKLLRSKHFSPMEHQATPNLSMSEYDTNAFGSEVRYNYGGNLGFNWIQYRKIL